MANAYVSAEAITLGEVIHMAIEQGYAVDVTHKDGKGRPVMINLLSADEDYWCREMSEEKSANGETHIGSMGDPRLANLNMVEEGSEDYNIVCHGHPEGVEW